MAVLSTLKRAARVLLARRVREQAPFRRAVEGKRGLEIGGPSRVFQDDNILPIYRWTGALDNCVFAPSTLWEGKRAEGQTFHFHARKPAGFHFIREATDLHGIADAAYDFVLSSHHLEHVANPLRALAEFRRVCRPGGAMVIVLPDHRYTFDHRRKPTPIAHIVEDFRNATDERDLTHLEENLELHDFSRDPLAGSPEEFRERSRKNFENRGLHHHVFDPENARQMLEAAGLQVEVVECVKPHHIVLLARN
jgi:SAM-dependent methyltransferase